MRRILLDPGHEWEEPGSTQADGQSEISYTLPVAQATRATLLAGWECEVFLTHEGAGLVQGGDLAAELEARSRLADRLQVDYFLSIHHNAGAASVDGAELYIHTRLRRYQDRITRYYPPGAGELVWLDAEADGPDGMPNHDAPRSLAAARAIVPIVSEALSAHGIRWRGRSNRIMAADFAVLRYCQVPCGLIETHFGTNPREDAVADQQEFRLAVAQALARGIAAYLDLPVRHPAPPSHYVRVILPPDPSEPSGQAREIDGELRQGTTWITIPGTEIEAPVRAVARAMGRGVRWIPDPMTAIVE